jgi:hypothetical protein
VTSARVDSTSFLEAGMALQPQEANKRGIARIKLNFTKDFVNRFMIFSSSYVTLSPLYRGLVFY